MIATAIAHRDVKPANAIHGAGPVVKWAGGKTRLLPELLLRLPPLPPGATYFEPFAGGAALFFALAPERAVLGDANADLIALYQAIADDVEDLIGLLAHFEVEHGEEFYDQIKADWNARAWDCDSVARAAAMLYLNRACFNGLWRVNAGGAFNVPVGRRSDGRLLDVRIDRANLRAAAAILARADLRAGDYRASLADARRGDLGYLDPPYDGTFTSYTAGAFDAADQRALAETVRELADRGVNVVVSNADTARIRELYAWARLDTVRAPRSISSDGEGRGDVDEVLVLAGPAFAITTRTRNHRPHDERTPATMTQPQLHPDTSTAIDLTIEDVIERGIRRVLPVKLTRDELTDIAIRRATAEAERDGMQLDLDREKKRRQALIEERDNEIEKMGRELRTQEQDRTVPCTKVFRRELDGSGWVVVLRNDTGAEVAREPASPQVLQRHLPHVDGPPNGKRSVLDQARDAQAAEEGGGGPDPDDPDVPAATEDLEGELGYGSSADDDGEPDKDDAPGDDDGAAPEHSAKPRKPKATGKKRGGRKGRG